MDSDIIHIRCSFVIDFLLGLLCLEMVSLSRDQMKVILSYFLTILLCF